MLSIETTLNPSNNLGHDDRNDDHNDEISVMNHNSIIIETPNNKDRYKDYLVYFYTVLIHIFIFSIFESLFFWFYITKEEDAAVLHQIEDVVLIGELFCTNINNDIDLLSLYNYQKNKRGTYNEKLPLNNTIMLNVYLFSSLILLNILMKVACVNLIKINFVILKHQSTTFLLLFLYEYIFFTNVVYNYVPNASNKIIKQIFENCI